MSCPCQSQELRETIPSSGKPWLLTKHILYDTMAEAKVAANIAIGNNFWPTWDVKYLTVKVNGRKKYAVYIRVSAKQRYQQKIPGWNLVKDTPSQKRWASTKSFTVTYPPEFYQQGTRKGETGDTLKRGHEVVVYQEGKWWKVQISRIPPCAGTHVSYKELNYTVNSFHELEDALAVAITHMEKTR